MKRHKVKYSIAICEEGNFTRAAMRCGVRQPSLTRAIQKLEQESGGALFESHRSSNSLTRLGALVRPYLTRINGPPLTRDAKQQPF